MTILLTMTTIDKFPVQHDPGRAALRAVPAAHGESQRPDRQRLQDRRLPGREDRGLYD